MKYVEEVVHRTREFETSDTSNVYSEIRSLLDDKIAFGSVDEVKYINDVDDGVIRAKIETMDQYDKYFFEEIEIYITIKENRFKIEIKGDLTARYPTPGWKGNMFYYAYIALLHRFIGLKNEHKYETWVEGKVDQIMRNIERIF